MFKRVLITGGAGFIGSHLADLLVETGYKVRVYDNLEPQVHGSSGKPPDYLNPGAEFVRGDILDTDALRKALTDVDAIIHCGALVGVGQSQYEIRRYTNVNTLGTSNLLDIMTNERKSVQRLVIIGSMSIYGEGLYRRPSDGKRVTPSLRPLSQLEKHDFEVHDPETGEALEPIPTPESKGTQCNSIYALGKKDQEDYAFLIGRERGVSVVATRFFNVYGPRQALSNPYTGAAAIFSSRLKNGHAPLIYEDGKQLRDFTYVRDVAEAVHFVMESPKAQLEAYNVCTGKPTSILELAGLLAKLYGVPQLKPEIVRKFRSGDIRHCYGDSSKLASLGWKSKITVEDGLSRLVKWSAEQVAVDQFDKAHRELESRGLVK
ncbi:MAG: NAD-dependent epimerase/dehydratase family protein [bacterium]